MDFIRNFYELFTSQQSIDLLKLRALNVCRLHLKLLQKLRVGLNVVESIVWKGGNTKCQHFLFPRCFFLLNLLPEKKEKNG